jgi:hypothetical protein
MIFSLIDYLYRCGMEQRDSSIYLFFRPFFKFVLHLLTGRTEI